MLDDKSFAEQSLGNRSAPGVGAVNPYAGQALLLHSYKRGVAEEISSRPVDAAAMVDLVHEHEALFAKDLVENPVISYPDPIDPFPSLELYRAARERFVSQFLEPRHNP